MLVLAASPRVQGGQAAGIYSIVPTAPLSTPGFTNDPQLPSPVPRFLFPPPLFPYNTRMSQALYRKWRPARFEQVVGQDHVTQTLQHSVAADRVGHAYLFCGPRGTGKTTSARLLAKAVNCLHEDPAERPCDNCRVCHAVNDGRFLDLIEIDAASNTGVDDIRDLRDKINFAPNEGRFKVYIIDEVHMLSTAAFNALLKTLEEPPPHAKFILATTEEHKVPLTIKSRCQQFNFRLLTTQEIIERLTLLQEREELQVESGVLALVARHGAGSLRDAESLLDQLIGAPDELITVEKAQAVLGTAAGEAISGLMEAILTGDAAGGLETIHAALNTGADARQFCRQMVGYLRDVLLIQTAGAEIPLDTTREQKEEMADFARRARRVTLVEAIKKFNEAAAVSGSGWQPQLPLELAFIESLPAEQAEPAELPEASAPAGEAEPAAEPEEAAAPPPKKKKKVEAAPEPAAAAPTPRPPAPRPAGEEAFTIGDIKGKVWREFVARAGKQNRNVKNWLNSSQPLAVEGNTLVIGFDLDFLKKKLEGEIDLVNEALSDILDQPARVQCVIKREFLASGRGQVESGRSIRDEVDDLAEELGGVVSETD